jgi:hypothetical protein
MAMVHNHHAYTDISHFRAPYKNWISLGAEAAPPTAPPAVPGSIPPQQAALLVAEPDGSLALKPEVAKLLTAQLQGHVIVVFDDNNVKLAVPLPGDVRENAFSWMMRKLQEGKTIIAGTAMGVSGLILPTGPVDKNLQAISAPGQIKQMTEQGTYAVLVRPHGAGVAKAGVLGPLGVAVVVLGVAGIAYAIWGKKKRHSAKI